MSMDSSNNKAMFSSMRNYTNSCPFWDYDDITPCGRARVINYLVPLYLSWFLLIIITYNVLSNYYQFNILKIKKKNPVDELLALSIQRDNNNTNNINDPESQSLLSGNNHSYTEIDNNKDNNDQSLTDRHFSIENLKLQKLNGQPHGKITIVNRSTMEKMGLILEFILVLSQLLFHIIILFKASSYHNLIDFNKYKNQNLINVIFWFILFNLVTIRCFNINQNKWFVNKYLGNLWNLSFFSYLIILTFNLLPFRSLLIGHITSPLIKNYYIFQFCIDLILFSLLVFSPIKNDFAVLYKTENDIIPSPESITSIASFVCWSWLDKFVWTANNHYITMKDVWGLKLEDYSIFVNKNFKNYCKKFVVSTDDDNNNNKRKKRTFTFKLLTFFSDYFLLQGFWAFWASLISFIPTILLKRILEYVEDQSSAPRNLAWFYVILMFVCKVFVAIANGQALFLGRRVCIRMKSIIISEIYSKALRRRISTTNRQQQEKDNGGNKDGKIDEVDPQERNQQDNFDGDEESTSKAQLGTIINLMAIDAFKISEICGYLHSFVEAVVMTIIALTLLYNLIGFSAIIGTVVILIMVPINFKLATIIGILQKKTLAVTDKRIQKLNEAFQAIRIIKFFSWEDNFEKDINEIRDKELKYIIKRTIIWGAGGFVWFITPTLVTAAAFSYYIYVQKMPLTTPIAFTALSLFALLRDPLDRLSDMLSFVIQSKISLDRVANFLEGMDTEKYQQLTIDPRGNKLAFENTTVSWDDKESTFKLRNLNIDFKIGKLNVVIGATGSGKTSLLMALLGEMHLLKGRIIVPSLEARQDLVPDSDGLTNSIAYCSQAAWLLNDTVRNNILFNRPFDKNRYEAVIKACGLIRDFEVLKAGDQTEIGEKGITLSGGQKQRISLARALYSDARHVLLDDCLSAVDAHTASWVYENCITGPLMENRTCILVSHNIALTLKNADLVVMLENGEVKDQGTPTELLDKGVLGEDELVKSSILSRTTSLSSIANTGKESKFKNLLMTKKVITESSKKEDAESTKQTNVGADDGKLIEAETKAEGVVSLDVYKWFLNIFGGLKVVSYLLILFFIPEIFQIGQSWWLRKWAAVLPNDNTVSFIKNIFVSRSPVNINLYSNIPSSSIYTTLYNTVQIGNTSNINVLKKDGHTTLYYLSIYLLFGLCQSTFAIFKLFLTYLYGIYASRDIFKRLLHTVLRAKLRFFDTTPIGRIMNRFSKDIESIDQQLTPYLHGAICTLMGCITTVMLITFITPQFISIAILVSILYYLVGYFYMAGSRELKRLDSITKSPIYQHFSETLVGVTTIRAFGDESRFLQENLQKIDDNNRPFFYLWVANRWLAFRIDMIGALVVFGAGIFILADIKNIDAGLAGISLTYAISFTEDALWLVRYYSEVEMNMNSVERLKEYMDIDQEEYVPHYNKIIQTPPVEWPQDGRIEVNNLSLRYAPKLPRVIKNVSFIVDPRSKVGIVGRTGAGKSTIITALFRFLDPETGYIKIDNYDISSIDLNRLRRAITIIPQDPTLFTGTIKSNLDPYDEYSDEAIFAALRRVNLVTIEELEQQNIETRNNNNSNNNNNISSDRISVTSVNVNRFLDLSNEVTEGGGNLSQGQRQLLCLARSLLRSPKILLLDEATASIDYDSDAKVQATIRQEFSESTILTIAHRLRSVIDYDKILVMDAGEVKEYDHPYSLLLNKESLFYSMCERSGELDSLIEMAKNAFVQKLNNSNH